MHEKLQFSWSHIIAFLALIVVSYISFVGLTYLTNGNFLWAVIGMGIIDIMFILVFIGAQQLKASGEKMVKKIIIERIFVFCSPVIFISGMIPMSHFWTVKSQNEKIVQSFIQSIDNAKGLFVDYESYVDKRLKSYNDELTSILGKGSNEQLYKRAGFVNHKADLQKQNMMETLRLQLQSQNYDSLKMTATKWIDKSKQGANTWNVFLLGNTREIKQALGNWEDQLKSFSEREMSNENLLSEVPKFSSNAASRAIVGIDSLTTVFTTQQVPNLVAIIFGIIIYLMLMFPYLLQDRHPKSIYRLIGDEHSWKEKYDQTKKESTDSYEYKQQVFDDREISNLNIDEDKDYPSF